MKLKALKGFRDLEAGVIRKPGEVFTATEARAKVILAAGFAEIVEEDVSAAEGAEAPKADEAPGPEKQGKKRRKKG